MIKFKCGNCGHKITVSEVHVGKKGKCPKCKNIIIVPEINQDVPLKLQDRNTDSLHYTQPPREPELRLKQQTQTQERFDGLSADGLNVTNESLLETETDEGPPERKLPWILDVFLYPTSMTGIIYLIIFPVFGSLLWLLTITNFFHIMSLLLLLLLCITIGYIFNYLANCVSDSAAGQIRAHDNLTQSNTASKWDCIGQIIRVLACLAVCFVAPIAYFFVTRRWDSIFMLLIISGFMFFPMTLLLIVMFDSFSALNPALIISSIIRTILQYLGLLIVFYGFGILLFLILRLFQLSMVSIYVATAIGLYFAMIAAHLLGRFYYLNAEKLNWEV